MRIAEHRRFDRVEVRVVRIVNPATLQVARLHNPRETFTLRLIGVGGDVPADPQSIEQVKHQIAEQTLLLVAGHTSAPDESACWAWAYLPDGRLLNEWVVAEGLSPASDDPPHDLQWWMGRLERRARSTERGIWRQKTGP